MSANYRVEAETIHIDNLRVEGVIGVHPHERERPQPLILSLSFQRDRSGIAGAGGVDSLEATIDYAEVARAVREFVRESRFRLLETLAANLAAHLAERFAPERLTLTIRKPAAIADSDGPAVSLTLVRDGEDGP